MGSAAFERERHPMMHRSSWEKKLTICRFHRRRQIGDTEIHNYHADDCTHTLQAAGIGTQIDQFSSACAARQSVCRQVYTYPLLLRPGHGCQCDSALLI